MDARRWMRTLTAFSLALTGFVCLTACDRKEKPRTPATGTGTEIPKTAEREPVKIGVVTTLTGNNASWGKMEEKAIALAVDAINAKGGLSGRPLKALLEDDQGTTQAGVSAFKKLIATTDIPIVGGFPLSGVTLAAAGTANREKVIILSSGSTATAVGKAGPYVFRIMPSDEIQAKIMAAWALELGYKRVGVLYVQNAWGQGLKDSFLAEFKKQGGTILGVEASVEKATDFRSQLTKLKDRKPDALYLPLYQREAGLAIRQARELGITQQTLGADVHGTPELLEAGGSAVEGHLYTTFGEYHGPEYQDFAKRYEQRFKEKPGTYATYAYDAFQIIVEALRRAGGPDADVESIRSELLNFGDYRGATGLTSFGGNNSASGKTFDRMTIKGGAFVPWVSGGD